MANLPQSGQTNSADSLTVTREAFRLQQRDLLEFLAQALGNVTGSYNTQTVDPTAVTLQGAPKLAANAEPSTTDDSLRLVNSRWVRRNALSVGTTAPTNPIRGQAWLDIGVDPPALKVWDDSPAPGFWYVLGVTPDATTSLKGLVQLADQAAIDAGTAGRVVDAAQLKASQSSGQFTGLRNRIINGGMATDQRNAGAAQTITAGAALAYSVDRWYAYCTGANVTGQQVQGASAGQFRYRFTGAASVTGVGFGQRIEQLNSADLAGTTATLSVDLANSVLTTVTWTAYYANTADTFGTLASPTRTLIATGTFTVSSTVTRYSANINIPAAATTGIEIVLSVGAQTSGTWTIGNVQLEAGTVATPFERRSYGQELTLCQRYFFKTYDPNTSPGAVTTNGCTIGTANGAAARPTVNVFFPVSMRAAPTVSLYSPGTGALGAVRNVDALVDYAGVVLYAGSNGTIWYPNATPSASNSITAHVTASSEL